MGGMFAPAHPVPIATGTTDAQVVAGATYLSGYSARESATVGAGASFVLRDGTDTSGTAVALVELAANQSVQVAFTYPIYFGTGIFLDRTEGETAVTVYTV